MPSDIIGYYKQCGISIGTRDAEELPKGIVIHYLQVWVEAGTPGLVMFILPFLFLIRGLWHIFHMRDTHSLAPETWTIGTAALALGMHAAIDFDLSFSSISLLLWALLALFACRERVMGFGLPVFKRKRFTQVFQGKLAFFIGFCNVGS